ncbi:MAG: DUF2490 domain-containing protein [Bacteroidia bacterium]|nr:DUF2490 domain-containing protein [Bacteroidia bacterium]
MRKTLACLALVLVLPGYAAAQVTWENQVWTSVQAEKKLFSKTRMTLTLETRFNTNPLMAVRYFPNLAVQRKWSDFFSSTVHYRYITSNKGMGVRESSHRLMLDAVFSGKIRKTDLAFRLRAGREDESGTNEGILTMSEFVLRQKFTVKRKILKQDFALSVEQFETIRGTEVEFDQRRYVLGTDFKLNKQNFINVFVMYQDLISTRRLNLGVGYEYKFND